ncbi:EscI/YscI/HrpB family type III secretion system inner rod protein [Pseudomonas sp. Marseille-Q1929]|uniref:EscI/YscI/HrpB family type III secretion system inner rod protein n=1 Tax=Pseudomonas sp. Marseille-Q1929 TaxID=2730402 RepID=UPI001A8EBDF2|nr:EscI/YscI/HrpB family type III secretion system inner rod protein [Pseudomonas sp. Marseille-Q1929]MBO0492091.1 type III secretion apparatus protein RspB [Pseudomonas sp. Marseille-Q1929]
MQIKELGFSAPHNSLEDTVGTRAHSTSTTDIGFFTSSLERSALPVARADNNQRPTLLAEAGQHVKALESRVAHALRSTNKGADPDDFKQYPRELSNVVLTSQLLVKSLGKATQCIDKISNLQ